ncbi:Cupin [Musa troglodytarum]|uniref:Cupin n=1 Tax=Musa troglodytarum TaxID=320322 RepID=A0A9E7IHN4_9LILI|nr:Cupin [Musa troglodytarum]
MRFRSVFFGAASRAKLGTPAQQQRFRRTYSHLQRPDSERPSFGIAFDIDGVILRGRTPIGGSPQALRRLYDADGSLKVPFLFLTNGGGVPETKRALELSELLKVQISALQVVQGHSPFRLLVSRFENELIVAIGKGEPAAVMLEYGFKKVLSIDDYAAYFNDIDPLSQYKSWGLKHLYERNYNSKGLQPKYDVYSERVKGAFVVSDPVDWGRDIQAVFPAERLGMGAFRIALESIYNCIHSSPLEYTSFGKPNPFVFKNAESILTKLVTHKCQVKETMMGEKCAFSTIYMIGDNPKVDINGAKKVGHPWFSILTRTGVFRGGGTCGIVLPDATKEKVIAIKKGDAIALPFGAVTWWFNPSDAEFVGHKAGQFTNFPITGGNGIFTGFTTEFVGRAWDLTEDEAKKLVHNQTNVGIVKVKDGQGMPEPSAKDREGMVVNCLEAPLDVDIKNGGCVVVLNTKNLPLVGEVGLGADLVRLNGHAMCSPGFSCDSAYQVTYVVRGSGRVQVVGVDGKRVLETTVKGGCLFIVPRFFVVSKIADADGLEWFSIITTPNPVFTHLAGKTSVWKAISSEVLQAAFNATPEMEKLFRSKRTSDEIFFPPPK